MCRKQFPLFAKRLFNSHADDYEYAPEQLLLFLYAAKQWIHINVTMSTELPTEDDMECFVLL